VSGEARARLRLRLRVHFRIKDQEQKQPPIRSPAVVRSSLLQSDGGHMPGMQPRRLRDKARDGSRTRCAPTAVRIDLPVSTCRISNRALRGCQVHNCVVQAFDVASLPRGHTFVYMGRPPIAPSPIRVGGIFVLRSPCLDPLRVGGGPCSLLLAPCLLILSPAISTAAEPFPLR
jgi:hypothetical protein